MVTLHNMSKACDTVKRSTYNAHVHDFTHLRSSVSCNNYINQGIKKRILVANKCFYGFQNQLKPRVLSRESKIILYNTLIWPLLTHESERWILSVSDEKLLLPLREKFRNPYMAQSKTTINGELGRIMKCTPSLRTWILQPL
jgi:hypothetical protein